MALTTATLVEKADRDQVGTIGRLKARRITVTFTAGYDSATGVTLPHGPISGINEILAVIQEGTATGTAAGATVKATYANGDANLVLFNGTTLVATADESATVANLLVIGH